MSDGRKTLIEEVFSSMSPEEKDIGAFLGPHRLLLWFSSLRNEPSCFYRIISGLSRKMEWESFEPGTTPVIAVHFGSIYSFKEFARQHAGTNEADAMIIGSSTEAALQMVTNIVQEMNLERLLKFEFSTEVIGRAMRLLPFSGLLTFDTWIEAQAAESSEIDLIDRRHEAVYGLEIKRPRDSIESDLFMAPLSESESLRLFLKILARKSRRNGRQSDGILRCWDLLKYARELQSFGAVNEAALVAVTAMEELLIPLTGIPYEVVKRDRVSLGKIISIVEKNKKLTSHQTHQLRELGDMRIHCAHAYTTASHRSEQQFRNQVSEFLDWLESYPDFLK